MVFWSAEEHIREQKPFEDAHDFDEILATRTPASWDQEEDVFEIENDVSPDSSIGEPEKIKEDIEMFIEQPKRSAPSSDSFFPWPFNVPDEYTESRQVKNTRMTPRETQNTEAADVPFDERIPPSYGRGEVPFDEFLLTVEYAQSTDSSLTEEKEFEVERCSPFMQRIQKESVPFPVSGNNESFKSKDGENGYPDKENEVSATGFSTQRVQVGLSSPTTRNTSSIDDLVYNLEAVARRIDALSNGIEDYRTMDSPSSVVMQKSTSIDYSESLVMEKLSVNRKFKVNDMKDVDEVEQCRSQEVEPLWSALSDGIEECLTMDSTGSQVKRNSSVEYTESLIRKLSTDKDCVITPDDKVDKYGFPMISEAKMFHPPSSTHKKTLITKDIDNLEDPLFDKIEEIRSANSINSILEAADEPTDVTHKLETINKKPPKCTILKKEAFALTPSRDAISQPSSSKKVRFAQELYETCPSDTSDLDFDYMKHAFEDDGKNMYDEEASVEEDSMEEAFFQESDYAGEESSPWFSLLLQAN